jgi:hypothetical protein
VRASDGDKLKISTVVHQDELVSFFGKYGEVCKNGEWNAGTEETGSEEGESQEGEEEGGEEVA